MDIGLNEEQENLRRELRDYYAKLLTPDVHEDLAREHGIGPRTRAVRMQMARDGWLCFGWPKEYGGQGRERGRSLHLLRRVDARRRAHPMLTVNTVGPTIMRYGTDGAEEFFLPKIPAGELDFCIGYSEPQRRAPISRR